MLEGVKRAVFFCAHTDDEMVCAGTLHRLARQGAEVHVVAFADAATRDDRKGRGDSQQVKVEFDVSMRLIGAKHWIGYALKPSSRLPERAQDVADIIFEKVETWNPDLVITLSPEDENTSHAVVGRESERVLRGRCPLVLRCQFAWNYCHGRPNVFVNLSPEDVEVKGKVCDCYRSQVFRYNYRDIFMSQARVDGLSVKAEFAERFELLRAVV